MNITILIDTYDMSGDLIALSGVGASAAICTAIARALDDEFGLNYNDEEINASPYLREKAYHGVLMGPFRVLIIHVEYLEAL